MPEISTTLVLVGVSMVAGVFRPTTAGEYQIVLKEHVNRQWTNELLSYPFEAPEDAWHVDSVSLKGPAGPMAVQLSDVEYWQKTKMVKSATLWLVGDLAPLTTNVYTVRYGTTPTNTGGRGDLLMSATNEHAEMSTSRFGVRLRLGGETYDQARAAASPHFGRCGPSREKSGRRSRCRTWSPS